MIDFETIFATYYKQLVFFAERLVGKIYAEDITADAFLKLYAAKDQSNPKSFLYTVISNDCQNHLKHLSRAYKVHNELIYSNDYMEAIEIKSDLLGRIWNQVEQLAPMEKKVIQGLFVNDFTVKELSGILKISVDTVRQYKMRGLKKLRLNFK